MSVVSYPGTYRDRHGEERLRFGNDGRELCTTIRGVDFAGGDFDMLATADAAPQERLASFSSNQGDLSECTFTQDIPLPVVVPAPDGAETIAMGAVRAMIELGAGRSDGHLDSRRLMSLLTFADYRLVSSGASDFFETELLYLQRQLPQGACLKACINCLHPDYGPHGQGSFGSMFCFRNIKDEYVRATSKEEFWAVYGRHDRLVQEIYPCDQFARRVPGTGYHG